MDTLMKVAEQMEQAQKLSAGVMPVRVQFSSDAEVREAKAWMKGKKKVKLLYPMTEEESDRLYTEAARKIEEVCRKKENWASKKKSHEG